MLVSREMVLVTDLGPGLVLDPFASAIPSVSAVAGRAGVRLLDHAFTLAAAAGLR